MASWMVMRERKKGFNAEGAEDAEGSSTEGREEGTESTENSLECFQFPVSSWEKEFWTGLTG